MPAVQAAGLWSPLTWPRWGPELALSSALTAVRPGIACSEFWGVVGKEFDKNGSVSAALVHAD